MPGSMIIKGIDKYASKPDLLKVMYLASVMVNSRINNLGLES